MTRNILPCGFKANGVSAGIKHHGRSDLALIYSDVKCKAVGLFTSNKIQAAPIKVCKEHLRKSRYFYAVLVNSGNANCFTGRKGIEIVRSSAQFLSKNLGIETKQILVASTGIIGKILPLDKIKKAIPDLVRGLTENGLNKAALAIKTTDTFAKKITTRLNIGNKTVIISGIAKGAGMIAPDLVYPKHTRAATMLCFLMTDADITQRALKKAIERSAESSFNSITVDGCMSTNDTLLILANGKAKNPLIDIGNEYFNRFSKALNQLCAGLAKMIVRDAEGATKFIQINVKGAESIEDAKKVALAIANSSLFKTAIYGENSNWGRVIAAVGSSGVDIKEEDLKIRFSSLSKENISLVVDLNRGKYCAVIYTSDLSPEYVKINAEYN